MRFPRATPALLAPPAAAFAVALLMAAYIAGYAWSAPNIDTADELLRAYGIRHGFALPFEGPPLGDALHLGPFWYYLTAIPLFAWHSWLCAVVFIGFVCSLKFPLAWHCGRKLLDSDFGLLWAAAMFVPGWATIEQLVALNANGVAMAMLATLAIALPGLERPAGLGRCALLGVAFALDLHTHPTSLPVFLLAPFVLRVRHRNGAPILPALAAMAAGFIVPLVPWVVSQASIGFPDWATASAYVEQQVSFANIVNAPEVVSAFFKGPETMALYVLGWPEEAAQALAVVSVAFAMLSVAALVAGPVARLRLAQFLAALAFIAAWVACARPTTPVQFTWALGPPIGALMALGLWALLRWRGATRPVVLAIVIAGFALNVWLVRELAMLVREGEASLPSLIMDTKGGLTDRLYRDVWFPAHEHGPLGKMLCDAGGPASLHGHLAYLVDKDLGLDLLFECNDRSRVSLVGSEAPRHHLAMSRPFWRAISALPDCWVGSIGLSASAIPLVPRRPIPVADGSTEPPRRYSGNAPREVTYTLEVPHERAVMITNVLGAYEHFEIRSARAGEQSVIARAENDFSAIFEAPAASTHVVRWTFRLIASDPEAVDIVSVAGRKGAEREEAKCLAR